MHVAFLTPEYPTQHACGGIGTSVRNLARSLVGLGHRVTVLGWGSQAESDEQGVKVRFLPATCLPRIGWFLNRWAAQHELNRMIRQESLEVVEGADWCGLSAFIRPNCPVLIRCHGSATYFADLLSEKLRGSVRYAEGCAIRQATEVVAVSAFAAKKTAEVFKLNRPIGVIPNGIDTSQFSPEADGESDPNLVLYFGTLVRKKGVLDLPRIFSRLLSERPEARLVLVGRDSRDPQTGSASTWSLIESALPPVAKGRVNYLGPKPHDEVVQLVRETGICVFPSYAEAFPVSWLEAMACAKPVVAYDLGWAGEAIEHGKSGVLVPAGDTEAFGRSLARLLAAPDERRRLGGAARQRVEDRFTSGTMARQSLAWYRRALGGGA
jgi:glycosyltransferase involved in cell wall biosynthesis